MSVSPETTAALRFGYGLRPGEAPVEGADGLLDQLKAAAATGPLFPEGGIAARHQLVLDMRKALRETGQMHREGDAREDRRILRQQMERQLRRDQTARIAQSVLSPHGFHERLAAFWLNHFAVSAGKTDEMRLLVPLFEAEAIRPRLAGHFGDLLQSVALHPAMMIYLDQTRSIGPNSPAGRRRRSLAANENFARELMELHTLGVDGGYDQRDVQQAALLLTGLTVDRDGLTTAFEKQRAEPGAFTVLGTSFSRSDVRFENALALLDLVARHPATAAHICRKLVGHFIGEGDATAPVVDVMVARWRATDGSLADVYEAMLRHPLAWQAEQGKVKMPFDYVVSTLRALGVSREMLLEQESEEDAVARRMARGQQAAAMASAALPTMGGDMQSMAAGSREEMAGIKPLQKPAAPRQPLGLVAQNTLTALGQPLWRPPAAAGFADHNSDWLSPSQLAQRIAFANRVVTYLGSEQDPRVFTHNILGDQARDDTLRIAGQAPSRRTGMVIALASPEFYKR